MILTALLYIRRVTTTTTVTRVTPEYVRQGRAHSLQLQQIPDGVGIYRIHGPFLFGGTDKLMNSNARRLIFQRSSSRVIAEIDRDVPDGDALDRADPIQHVGGRHQVGVAVAGLVDPGEHDRQEVGIGRQLDPLVVEIQSQCVRRAGPWRGARSSNQACRANAVIA